MEANKKQTTQKVKQLDDRSQARDRLQVFFDSRDNFMHGLRESLANATDECNNNFTSGTITIELEEDNMTICVTDTGRGINIEEVDEEGKPYYDLLFTTLFAGSKYDNEDGVNYTGGNGCGNTVLNFTSDLFEVESIRNGKKYRVEYRDGGFIQGGLQDLGECEGHGSSFRFKLDPTMYTNTIYNSKIIEDIINKKSGVCNKLTFKYKYNGIEKIYHYESLKEYFDNNFNVLNSFVGSSKQYINELETTKKVFNKSTEKWENKKMIIREEDTFEALIGLGENVCQETFLNDTHLVLGGKIQEGFNEGIKVFINKYCKDNALYNKNEKNIGIKDIEDTVSFVVKVLSSVPEFKSQTKFSTEKELYKILAKKYAIEILEIMSIEKKEQFKDLVNKILISKRATEKANITRNAVRKELEKKVNNTAKDRIAKFIPCRETRPEETELYLVEGDSAAGAVAKARNKINQCLYPLKGKVLNVSKKTIDEILKNKEILDIFKILGCGMTHNGKNVKGIPVFNMDNLNMHKICILSDEDVDGSHIASLIVNMFFVLAPMLIEKGMVYRCLSPLYKITTTKDEKVYYAYDEEEKNKITRELSDKKIKYNTKYYKGLGGFDAEELAETTMDKDNRRMIQVTMQDVVNAKEMLEIYFRDDTINKRKDFILENGATYFNPHNI